jgi:protein-L-isoaspartate(D-aspartate) O-methyltransferase
MSELGLGAGSPALRGQDLSADRRAMVDDQLVRRGISDPRVLAAFQSVPRHEFVEPGLREFAYRDTPLPIGSSQTISQPYVVALTAQALALTGTERVLEVGTGSGYAAGILSRLAREVFTVERHEALALRARERLERLGYANVLVLVGDGTLGYPEQAPYDAIAVAAGAPEVPRALLDQLAPGGRLVIPVGPKPSRQVLMRVTREADDFRQERILGVRFVPLIGEQGFSAQHDRSSTPGPPRRHSSLVRLLREVAEALDDQRQPETPDGASARAIDALLERIGEARVVLLGEATHGSSEFYRMRARVSRALIERKGFSFVAVEADWPDAARIDEFVRGAARRSGQDFVPFSRFPTWMWRNRELDEFVRWLHKHNSSRPELSSRVGFHGLDLYSLFTSIGVVLDYLDGVDTAAARVARARYGLLTPWQQNPAAYGRAVLLGKYESSESAVLRTLQELLARRLEYVGEGAARHGGERGERFFDATQNARLVADAEAYYRAMYYGDDRSWNLRDRHMFTTLEALLTHYGPAAKGIVWEHNSHIGDAAATEMSSRGQLNLGQLARERFGRECYNIGFGTDHGSVAAASEWGGPLEIKRLLRARAGSYERLCHQTELACFLLQLRDPPRRGVRDALLEPRLERAIGVVYLPESELTSHYFHASLPRQFDEYFWFDETRAIEPLPAPPATSPDLPETYPFGL